jgi:CHAT domain
LEHPDDFSPIVERRELATTTLSRLRRTRRPPSVGVGYELVLANRDGQPIAAESNILGRGRSRARAGVWITIDIAEHMLEFKIPFPDPTGRAGFLASVTVRAAIVDASKVAASGIRGVKGIIEPILSKAIADRMSKVKPSSCEDPVAVLNDSRRAAEGALRTSMHENVTDLPGWLAAHVTSITVTFDDATKRHYDDLVKRARESELIDASAEIKTRQTRHEIALRDAWRAALAEHLSNPAARSFEVAFSDPTPENIARVVDQVNAADAVARARVLHILSSLIDHGHLHETDELSSVAMEIMGGLDVELGRGDLPQVSVGQENVQITGVTSSQVEIAPAYEPNPPEDVLAQAESVRSDPETRISDDQQPEPPAPAAAQAAPSPQVSPTVPSNFQRSPGNATGGGVLYEVARDALYDRATRGRIERLRDLFAKRFSRQGSTGASPPFPAAELIADFIVGPPRSAYARLESPDAVVSHEPFEIVVGLAPQAVAGVVGEKLLVPDSVIGSYTLTVQVVADGFGLVHGGDWRVEMSVTAQAPYPTLTLRLAAESQDAPVLARTLQAVYSIEGQTIGLALRPIAVLRDATQSPPAAEPIDPGFDVALPEGWVPPDLTIHILRGKEEHAGRLLWTFETPHVGVNVPHEEIPCEIGEEPAAFAARLTKKMPSYEGQPGLYQFVAGIGSTVADHVPTQFWSLLADVARQADNGVPSVLILSAEPYVPWELALMEEPLQADVAPFLSAQARVGRWVLGHRRPKMPPPMSAGARSMAVVFGVYAKPGWRRLKEAEAEAADLQSSYEALPVNADSDAVLKCITGDPPADVLHFSVHGQYDPSGIQDGLVLVDGRTLDPMVVKGSRFESPRFVFLNACQVGQGYEVLGDYSGMAAAFLYAGAAGVVAPLWSIDDALARQLACDFYKAAFEGAAPADLLRMKRADFRADLHPASSTYIAYQFFGHPDMLLERT